MLSLALTLVVTASTAAADRPDEEEVELWEQGRVQFEAGQYAEAAESFERADTLVPTTSSITNAATAYVYAGQCNDALTVLQRLLERSEEIRQDTGVRRVTQIAERERDAPDWRRCSLANRLVRAVELSLGLAVPDDAPEQEARDFAQLGHSHYDASRFASSALFFQLSYDCYPIADALFNAAMALNGAGRQREAVDACRRFIAESPELRESEAVTRALRGIADAENASEVESCVQFATLRRAIAEAWGEDVTVQRLAGWLFRVGVQQYQNDHYEAAAVSFECCYELAPRPRLFYNLALARYQAGDTWGAVEAFDHYVAAMGEAADDPAVVRARRAFDAEPELSRERAAVLLERYYWAIQRAEGESDRASGDPER
jgi:tetratricopeptide (TPR) repeat protein